MPNSSRLPRASGDRPTLERFVYPDIGVAPCERG